MARPGLALYGLAPEFVPEEPEAVAKLRGRLQRVLEWKTQVVDPETNGLMVQPGDVTGLTQALTRLLESPELRQRLGAAARHTVDASSGAIPTRSAISVSVHRSSSSSPR